MCLAVAAKEKLSNDCVRSPYYASARFLAAWHRRRVLDEADAKPKKEKKPTEKPSSSDNTNKPEEPSSSDGTNKPAE